MQFYNPLRQGKIIFLFLFTCASYFVQAQVNYITTIAGKAGVPASDSGDGSQATNARFYGPYSLCVDKTGNIYIADSYNSKIRKINNLTSIITNFAGSDSGGFAGDGGQATNSLIAVPQAIMIDNSNNLLFADGANNRIRKINMATHIISTIAGNGAFAYTGDGGPATNAAINAPSGLCIDKIGNIFIADYGNNVVRKIDATTNIITTFAGRYGIAYTGDGGPATNAQFSSPIAVFSDSADNIYISDQYNSAVRKVDATTNIITTVAGNGNPGYSGDGGFAKHAELNQPTKGFVDNQNNIYFTEFGNGVVRRVDGITGIITTVAGNGTWGWAGDGGPATAAELSCTDLAIDNNGCMIIADYGTNTIRKVYNTKLETSPRPSPEERVPYPNPATDELHMDNFANSDLIIYNLLGREMLAAKLKSDKETVGIKHLTPGIYLLKIITENGEVQNYRVVKE